jgi:hypothetical protein
LRCASFFFATFSSQSSFLLFEQGVYQGKFDFGDIGVFDFTSFTAIVEGNFQMKTLNIFEFCNLSTVEFLQKALIIF